MSESYYAWVPLPLEACQKLLKDRNETEDNRTLEDMVRETVRQ